MQYILRVDTKQFVNMLTLLINLIIFLLGYKIYQVTKRRRDEPPGPFKWGFLGNLPQIALVNWTRVWLAINHYAESYGDVMGLYFGPRYVVVLSHPKAVTETMKLNEWNGRPKDNMAKVKGNGRALGVIWTDGDLWRETRRFSIRHLRDFGFGRAEMEASIAEEVRSLEAHMVDLMEKNDGVLGFEKLFGPPVVSTLWKMVAGSHCAQSDPKVKELQEIVTTVLRKRAIGAGLFWSFEFLRHWFPKQSGFDVQLKGFNQLKAYMRELVEEHKEMRRKSCGGGPRDFIDVYLEEMEKNPGNENFFEEQLIVTTMDFFVAGSETTATTLQYCFLYLILYPEVQDKIQKEIDFHIGPNRRISLDDKDKLVYTEATITEIHRIASVAPIVTPHATTENVIYRDYTIPKNSLVFINTWGIHRNKEKWGDPENFRPERFLDENGNYVPNDEWVLPFGYGKRKCPGEILARSSIFLILTNLLQKFTFRKVPGTPTPSTTPIIGLNLLPQPYSALVSKRNVNQAIN